MARELGASVLQSAVGTFTPRADRPEPTPPPACGANTTHYSTVLTGGDNCNENDTSLHFPGRIDLEGCGVRCGLWVVV